MSFSNYRPFYTKIISHDKSCNPIEYNTPSDYCIYNVFDNDNKTQHIITLINKHFKFNYIVNQKNILNYIEDTDTIYSGEIDIYMNNIISIFNTIIFFYPLRYFNIIIAFHILKINIGK